MKKYFLVSLVFVFFANIGSAQLAKPNDRWFIKPQVFFGYNSSKLANGWSYGAALRCLYDFEARFLGGPVFLGMESAFISPMPFVEQDRGSKLDPTKMNYVVTSIVLEQNYPLFNHGFNMGTGVGFYKGIQDMQQNAVGIITNLGWFPIYKGKTITPHISYRNDWIFDSKKSNVHTLSIGLNF